MWEPTKTGNDRPPSVSLGPQNSRTNREKILGIGHDDILDGILPYLFHFIRNGSVDEYERVDGGIEDEIGHDYQRGRNRSHLGIIGGLKLGLDHGSASFYT